jgi:putative membrane protein
MPIQIHLSNLLNAVVFSIVGVILLAVAFIVWDWLTPYDLWGEIVQKQNVALAVFSGFAALAVGIIVAAACI